MTALQLSAKEDLDQVTSILIDKTDVSQLIKPSIANFPLHSLCKSQIEKLDIIEKILKKLKDASVKKNFLDMGMKAVDSKQASLMHIAVEFNHSNIVESLLTKYNGDCKVKDSNGNCQTNQTIGVQLFYTYLFIRRFSDSLSGENRFNRNA